MTISTIREKLYDFIKVADDKKVKAIYLMLEDEISEETEWWKDKRLMGEFDRRYKAWETGKEKGYSLEEVNVLFEGAKKKLRK
jgi:hypothetical protein